MNDNFDKEIRNKMEYTDDIPFDTTGWSDLERQLNKRERGSRLSPLVFVILGLLGVGLLAWNIVTFKKLIKAESKIIELKEIIQEKSSKKEIIYLRDTIYIEKKEVEKDSRINGSSKTRIEKESTVFSKKHKKENIGLNTSTRSEKNNIKEIPKKGIDENEFQVKPETKAIIPKISPKESEPKPEEDTLMDEFEEEQRINDEDDTEWNEIEEEF